MRLEDLFERIKEELRATWERVQSSSLYVQFMERFEELDPKVQRLIRYASAFLVLYFVLSFPLGWLSTASDNRAKYERNRHLIEGLLEVEAKMQSSPNISVDLDMSKVSADAKQTIESTGIAPDQITSSKMISDKERKMEFLPEGVSFEGVLIRVEKINVNQILDAGTRLQNLNPSAKLVEMDIQAAEENDHYYDVEYLLAGFKGATEAKEK